MRKLRNRNFLSVFLSVVVSFVFVAVVASAATTISTNINTGGTLTVSGASTLNGSVTLGNVATDVNLFTGTLQASTTALFTNGATLYGTTTITGARPFTLGVSGSNLGGVTAAGTIFYDSTNSSIKLYDGAQWFTVGTTTTGIQLSGPRVALGDLTTQYMTIGTTTQSGFSMLTLEATTTDAIPLTIKAYDGQTADLLRFHNVLGTELFAIDKNGNASTSIVTASGDIYVNDRATTTAANGNFATEGTIIAKGAVTIGDEGADTLTINSNTVAMGTSATTTLPDNVVSAWEISTSTTATPILSINTSTSGLTGHVGIASTTPYVSLGVTGTTTSSAGMVIGAGGSPVSEFLFGVCTVNPEDGAIDTANGTTSDCTASGVTAAHRVFVTPNNLPAALYLASASSTGSNTIQVAIGAATSSPVITTFANWQWIAVR
jgi:hypothetical protein